MRIATSKISQITYAIDSGTILPELQWHEQFVITRNQVTLSRNGRVPGSEVNAGTWTFPADGSQVKALFRQLEGVNGSRIKRVEPDDPPEGGYTESYTILYSNGKTHSLWYDPGTTYAGGEIIVKPVKAFIQGLVLPATATSRHKAERS